MTNLILDQGATWRRGWTDKVAGVPVDLTGAYVRFQARLGLDGAALLDLDNATKGGVTLGGTSGTIDLFVSAATSSALILPTTNQGGCGEVQSDGTTRNATGTLCVWAMEATLASGDTVRLDEGILIITREVVR